MANLTTRTISVVATETTYITLPVQIPLTTTFTPPSTCLGPTFTISSPGYDNDYILFSIVTRGADPRCFPPGFIATSAVPEPPTIATVTATEEQAQTPSVTSSAASSNSQTAPGSSDASVSGSVSVFSISSTVTRTASATITQVTFSGVGCPESYTTATFTSALLGGQPFNVITCCPPSMTASIPPSSLQVFLSPAVSCVVRDSTIVLQSFTSAENTVTSTVWAPAVLAISPTTSATTSATSTPSTPSPQSDSLSTGAKAGIGVGVGLGVLFLVCAIAAIFIYRRRKPKKAAEADEPVETSVSEKFTGAGFGEKAELPDNSKAIAEMGDQGKEEPEMEGGGNEQVGKIGGELPVQETTAFRAELEGDNVPETRGDTLLDDQENTGAGKPT